MNTVRLPKNPYVNSVLFHGSLEMTIVPLKPSRISQLGWNLSFKSVLAKQVVPKQ